MMPLQFSLRIALAIWGLLWFHMNLKVFLFLLKMPLGFYRGCSEFIDGFRSFVLPHIHNTFTNILRVIPYVYHISTTV